MAWHQPGLLYLAKPRSHLDRGWGGLGPSTSKRHSGAAPGGHEETEIYYAESRGTVVQHYVRGVKYSCPLKAAGASSEDQMPASGTQGHQGAETSSESRTAPSPISPSVPMVAEAEEQQPRGAGTQGSRAVGQDVVTPLVQEDKPKAGLSRWPQSVSMESSLPEGEAEPNLLPQCSSESEVQSPGHRGGEVHRLPAT